MGVVAWTDKFATGLGVVDRQHRRSVELVNRLADQLIARPRADDRALACAFARLRDHTLHHFADEERLMLNAGVDERHCEGHRRAHAQLIELIDSVWGACATTAVAAKNLVDVLSPWFVQHTLGVDMFMAEQIRLLRQGESAEHAYELACAGQVSDPKIAMGALRQLFQVVSDRNHDLEQDVRERARSLEQTHLALIEARYRLEHLGRKSDEALRLRAQRLRRVNRALATANRRLKDKARTDGLLGIANRACFDERLDSEWRRATRDGLPLSLLMIDVDHFKRFNDTYGHPAGDRALQAIARNLAQQLQRPGDFLARYGGEELVIILSNTDLAGACALGEILRERIHSLDIERLVPGGAGPLTVSIGAAGGVPGSAAASAAQLVGQADEALYRAKREGRDRLCRCRVNVSHDGAMPAEGRPQATACLASVPSFRSNDRLLALPG